MYPYWNKSRNVHTKVLNNDTQCMCQPKVILHLGGEWPSKFALCHFDLGLKTDLGCIPAQRAVHIQRLLNCPKELIWRVDYLCLAGRPNSKSCLLWQARAVAGFRITIPSVLSSWGYFSEKQSPTSHWKSDTARGLCRWFSWAHR